MVSIPPTQRKGLIMPETTNGNWRPTGSPVTKNVKVTFTPGVGVSSKTGETYHQVKIDSPDKPNYMKGIRIGDIIYTGRLSLFGSEMPSE